MARYDYRCEKCGAEFEREEPMSAEPSVHCVDPKCDGKVKRIIGKVGIAFKGSGFYVTDSTQKTGTGGDSN